MFIEYNRYLIGLSIKEILTNCYLLVEFNENDNSTLLFIVRESFYDINELIPNLFPYLMSIFYYKGQLVGQHKNKVIQWVFDITVLSEYVQLTFFL